MTSSKLILKRMGVMNITPNSFSDGCQLETPEAFHALLQRFGSVDCIDLGAESTAPMNSPISWKEEWTRLKPFLPLIKDFQGEVSIDTYHPETIFEVVKIWKDEKRRQILWWNDVSGKFDEHVRSFLKESKNFKYVLCHNLAPSRELSSSHMNYLSLNIGDDFLKELAEHFHSHLGPQVILDPTLGFSKTYEQNWYILDHFEKLQALIPHDNWLLGFSRKSFLRKKFNLGLADKDKLDELHGEILKNITMKTEVWIRTHRPELL